MVQSTAGFDPVKARSVQEKVETVQTPLKGVQARLRKKAEQTKG